MMNFNFRKKPERDVSAAQKDTTDELQNCVGAFSTRSLPPLPTEISSNELWRLSDLSLGSDEPSYHSSRDSKSGHHNGAISKNWNRTDDVPKDNGSDRPAPRAKTISSGGVCKRPSRTTLEEYSATPFKFQNITQCGGSVIEKKKDYSSIDRPILGNFEGAPVLRVGVLKQKPLLPDNDLVEEHRNLTKDPILGSNDDNPDLELNPVKQKPILPDNDLVEENRNLTKDLTLDSNDDNPDLKLSPVKQKPTLPDNDLVEEIRNLTKDPTLGSNDNGPVLKLSPVKQKPILSDNDLEYRKSMQDPILGSKDDARGVKVSPVMQKPILPGKGYDVDYCKSMQEAIECGEKFLTWVEFTQCADDVTAVRNIIDTLKAILESQMTG